MSSRNCGERGGVELKSQPIQYYVEGKDEEKLLSVLKTEMKLILPGNVQKLNVVECKVTPGRLRALRPQTMVVLIFDTDTGKRDILDQNIERLRGCPAVSEIVTIPQVPNLEEELARSCGLRDIRELFGCAGSEFKSKLIKAQCLKDKLLRSGFNFNLLWSQQPTSAYQGIENSADKIRMPHRRGVRACP